MTEVLSWRQARWAEILSSYNFIIEHLEENMTLQTEHQDDLVMMQGTKGLLHDSWQLWVLPPHQQNAF